MDSFLNGVGQQPYGWQQIANHPQGHNAQQPTAVSQQFLGTAFRQTMPQRAFSSPAPFHHAPQEFYAQLAFNAQPTDFSRSDCRRQVLNHHQAVDQLPDFALNEELGGLALQQQPSPQQFNQLPVYTTQPPYSQRAGVPRSRFSREEQEFLEAEYQKDHKPTTAVKRSLALRLGVETPRINNWFQNRRAREKKDAIVQNYQAKLQRESEEAERDRALLASSAPFPDQSMTGSSSTRHGSPLDYSAEELTPESCADVSQASSSPMGSPSGLPTSSSLDYVGFESSPSVRTCDDDDSPVRPQLRGPSRRSYRFNPLAAVPRGVPLVASHSFDGISSMGMLEESMSVPMDRRMTVPGYGKMEMHHPEGFKLDSPWMGADSYGQM